MTDHDDRWHLRNLAIGEPWCRSTEGLDDCCMFCGSWESRWHNPGYTYWHERDCVWLRAREYLGLQQPEHVRGPRGDK